jgi:hypothetical protein
MFLGQRQHTKGGRIMRAFADHQTLENIGLNANANRN